MQHWYFFFQNVPHVTNIHNAYMKRYKLYNTHVGYSKARNDAQYKERR